MTAGSKHRDAAGHIHSHDHETHDHSVGESANFAQDQIEFLSVGVDIGSATSHLIFSQLVLEKIGNKYETVERNVIFESEIILTPFAQDFTIDQNLLGQFINQQYERAGIARDLVDTGALILTGVALLRQNSRIIADLFSSEVGRFVSVSAGDNMEAVLAARGSGATSLSNREHIRLLHVDIGGGTTKVSICSAGRVLSTLAIDVGARTVVLDAANRIVRLEASGKKVAQLLGIDLSVGDAVANEDMGRIIDYLVEQIVLGMSVTSSAEVPTLLRGPSIDLKCGIDSVTFSGGVAEYIYGREVRVFGDLGLLIARSLRMRLEKLGISIRVLDAGIRATVLGASQYTTQVSGSTIFLSSKDVVPIRNVQVIPPAFDLDGEIKSEQISEALAKALTQYDLVNYVGPLGISFAWEGQSSFFRVGSFARGIINGLLSWNEGHDLVVLLCNNDVGRLLGRHLVNELGLNRPLICIDCIDITDFGFVDVGTPVSSTGAVPVVIKSLVFPN